MNSRFSRRKMEFPNEGFIYASVKTHFLENGFYMVSDLSTSGPNFTVQHPTLQSTWVIKPTTSESDFRSHIGQLVQDMTSPAHMYAIAMPGTPPFLDQCRQIDQWIRQRLNLFWILVDAKQSVKLYAPFEEI